jgi:uncharacterized damage-inducible protein DinB
MALEFTKSCLHDSISLFRHYKKLADRAIEQVKDDDLHVAIDPESNSIAVVMRHIAGNMRSRWTDFLTSDGEKPDRNRDAEFEPRPVTRQQLIEEWERAWTLAFETLETLTDADMSRTVMIRGEAHSVTQAIHRQVAHAAYHSGQIVFLARHLSHETWTSLSIPRGKSEEFNAKVAAGKASQR